eukprot:scaffold44944_cov41-Tisochrysis_lutea.AAC.2
MDLRVMYTTALPLYRSVPLPPSVVMPLARLSSRPPPPFGPLRPPPYAWPASTNRASGLAARASPRAMCAPHRAHTLVPVTASCHIFSMMFAAARRPWPKPLLPRREELQTT